MTPILVSLIVPCCDEEESLPVLWDRLQAAQPLVPGGYALEYVFIDDGSRDRTWEVLLGLAAGRNDFVLLRNEARSGIGFSLRRALPAAHGDVIAMMDADGTYDPAVLPFLIGRLAHADLVTGSPYHPEGSVENVPAWRLFLSRTLSRAYRAVSPVQVWTYTSLFRAYRREVLEKVAWKSDGFLSNTEILIGAGRAGFRIEELPTTLSVRRYGQSKLRTFSVAREHARYLCREAVGLNSRPIEPTTNGGTAPVPRHEKRGFQR